jgi:MoaA/NifB/PqqE/SkfB family radical SAM enzyme
MDQTHPLPTDYQSKVTLLQVEPTTRCNFTCGFCCGRQMDQNDISLEVVRTSLEKFPQLERMELHGEGEPMMHPDIFEMMKLGHERGLRISSITNGSLFTTRNIDQLLNSGIETLFVSIESPDADAFKDIRGGSLVRVKRGIKRFLQERDARGMELPTLGFSVTVLKRTQHELSAIADLYRELGMDGGVSLHMLNKMPAYTDSYTDGMDDQILSNTEHALAWTRYTRLTARDEFKARKEHFSDTLFGQTGRDKNQSRRSQMVKEYRSCIWLDQGLYVNRHGATSGCARIKNTDQFGFGSVLDQSAQSIIESRDALKLAMLSGSVPKACGGCFIAESIANRLSYLINLKPTRVSDKRPYAAADFSWDSQVIGSLTIDVADIDLVVGHCDGNQSCAEIAELLADRWQIPIDDARGRVLPIISELAREKLVSL